MKSIPKAKGTAGTLAVVLSLLTLGLSGPIAPPASAGSIDKTFEIGPGTQFARSNHRTFAVPSGLTVSAKVDFYRLGDPGTANDIPIIIELRQPGANAEQDGPIVQQVSATARRTSVTPGGDGDTVTLTGAASSSGCGNPWRVRVRHAGTGDPAFAVKGTITATFNDDSRSLDIDPNNINIAKGNKVVKGLQGIIGSGTVRIKGEWHTSPLELLHIGSFHRLTVRLKRNGSTVKSESGYSQHAPADKTPKLDFTHFVPPDQVSGNWQLEIESFAPVDIVDFHIKESGQFGSTFRPGCN